MPPLSTTVEKLSWPAFPRNLSDEVKAGAYKNLLEKYFEEVPLRQQQAAIMVKMVSYSYRFSIHSVVNIYV